MSERQEPVVDVKEVRKLDTYLKGLFGNPRIRVVPRPGKPEGADVFIGEERIGNLSVDDEDGERSYNLEIKITMGEAADIRNLKILEAYFKHKFNNERIRVRPRVKKTDSVEVYIGEEYIGVVFFDEKDKRSCFFEMAILDMDLEETRSI
jgi:hypothetical protein